MKEYIIGLAAITLVCGLITSLSGTGGSAAGLRTVCGICVVAVIVLPAASLTDGLYLDVEGITDLFVLDESEVGYYDEIYNSNFALAEMKNAEKRLKSEIIQELSAENDDFDVCLVMGDESGEKFIERVEVIIYAKGISIDPHSVEKYIKSRLGCPCDIIYDL